MSFITFSYEIKISVKYATSYKYCIRFQVFKQALPGHHLRSEEDQVLLATLPKNNQILHHAQAGNDAKVDFPLELFSRAPQVICIQLFYSFIHFLLLSGSHLVNKLNIIRYMEKVQVCTLKSLKIAACIFKFHALFYIFRSQTCP